MLNDANKSKLETQYKESLKKKIEGVKNQIFRYQNSLEYQQKLSISKLNRHLYDLGIDQQIYSRVNKDFNQAECALVNWYYGVFGD